MSRRRPSTIAANELLLRQDLEHPVEFVLGSGTAVVFTRRAPDKTGPNEDAIALLPGEPGGAVIALADGAGGMAGGAEASNMAMGCLAARVAAHEDSALRERILDGIEQASREIGALGIGAATTIAVAEIQGASVRPYHVGDSELMIVGQRGRLKLQTVSHSPVGYAVESGMLDPADALDHAERHLVSNLVGSADMRIEIGAPIELAPRDTLVLGSDGLFDNLHPGEIRDLVRAGPLPACAARLAAACLERMQHPQAGNPSKPDDLGFVLFRLRRGAGAG